MINHLRHQEPPGHWRASPGSASTFTLCIVLSDAALERLETVIEAMQEEIRYLDRNACVDAIFALGLAHASTPEVARVMARWMLK
mgnify:FL=1|jgi:hypothetical protein